jgi:hypothetical protein
MPRFIRVIRIAEQLQNQQPVIHRDACRRGNRPFSGPAGVENRAATCDIIKRVHDGG